MFELEREEIEGFHNGPQFIDSRHIEELSGYITLGLEFEMGIFRMKDL